MFLQLMNIANSLAPTCFKHEQVHYRHLTDAQVVKETLESRQEPLLRPFAEDDVRALATRASMQIKLV